MCWHKWGNWVQFERKVKYWLGEIEIIRADGAVMVETWESKCCDKCGKMKSRKVR